MKVVNYDIVNTEICLKSFKVVGRAEFLPRDFPQTWEAITFDLL